MINLYKDRLPGIRFTEENASPSSVLPRMDIAGFVGIASDGPYDKPIAVESVSQYRAIFGEDAAIALNPGSGEIYYANLGSAVEAFFKNGGKRCWIVRSAIGDEAGAGERLPYSRHLFLDNDLLDLSVSTLASEMNRKLLASKDRPAGEELKGLHSFYAVEEVTLISLPDALHRQWEPIEHKTEMPEAPKLSYQWQENRLTWTDMGEGTIYTLQQSDEPLFLEPVTLLRGEDIGYLPETDSSCAELRYYRVNSLRDDCLSPWSELLQLVIPVAQFEECRLQEPISPDLQLNPVGSPASAGEYLLSWTAIAGSSGYVLEESGRADFESARLLYEGKETEYPIHSRTEGDYFFRVRAKVDHASAWSDTVGILDPGVGWQFKNWSQPDSDQLVALHRAMLNFSMARGDIFSVLDLPRHFRQEELSYHVDQLKLTQTDRVLSFGALYHPWLYMNVSEANQSTRWVPPAGAVCGTMASRALSRGAWIAPANEPLKEVFALETKVDEQLWKTYIDQQVNIVQQDPRGFMLLSSMTLSSDNSIRPINVRRLLSLLRRLAINEGVTYVFRPNNQDFHRQVQHRFQQLLSRMFMRGAFAGQTPDTSFQVITGSSVNTPSSLDQGRFIVELRVAPSLPMVFITVQLVQTHNDGVAVLEI